MADPRFFAKMDVGYLSNPKISNLLDDNPRAVLLHFAAILYCRQHLTDGTFPIRQVVRVASASYCGGQCDEQCESQCDWCATLRESLFEVIDSRNARVHDYLEHQDSPEVVRRRKNAGMAGAAARWGHKKEPSKGSESQSESHASRNAEERRGEESNTPPTPHGGSDGGRTPLTLLGEVADDGDRFEEFYDLFAGRKKSPTKAKAAWKRALKKKGVTASLLIERGSAYVTAQKSNGKFPQYTKYPENWLNDEMWEADLPTTGEVMVAPAEDMDERYRRWHEAKKAREEGAR